MTPFLTSTQLRSLLRPLELIEALRKAFIKGVNAPARTHIDLGTSSSSETDTLLLMPAWDAQVMGVKLATIHPGNPASGLPAVHATYVLTERATGKELVRMDGSELTRLRTAAASALAASYLAPERPSTLLMIGAGALAAPLIRAHAAVREYERILIWNRSESRRERLEQELRLPLEWVENLDEAVSIADVISCATLSTTPLVNYHATSARTHVDLVGAYRHGMRESDTALIQNADVFVDTHEGAQGEAGDLLAAKAESGWQFADIEADLAALCRGDHPGRVDPNRITVFKSVGASIEDLAAARLAWERFSS